MSYHIGLSFEFTLGGIVCFCGIPVSKTQIRENWDKELNILTIAGGKDIYFPLDYLKNQTENILQNFEKLILKEYPNEEHTVTTVGLEDTKNYIAFLIK